MKKNKKGKKPASIVIGGHDFTKQTPKQVMKEIKKAHKLGKTTVRGPR